MAGHVASYVAKKALGREMDKYKHKKPAGANDPFFEYIDLPNGKKKKVRKQIPDYIPEHDALVLKKAKKWAYRFDVGLFRFAGIQFGWSSVIGFVPAVGDIGDMGLALWIFKMCCSVEEGLEFWTQVMMLLWIIGDFAVGLVPFVGDLADAAIRCNSRNVAKLEEVLMQRHGPKGMDIKEKRKSRLVDMGDDEPKRTFDEKDRVGPGASRVQEPPHKSQKTGRRWYGGDGRPPRDDLETGARQGRHDAR